MILFPGFTPDSLITGQHCSYEIWKMKDRSHGQMHWELYSYLRVLPPSQMIQERKSHVSSSWGFHHAKHPSTCPELETYYCVSLIILRI